MEMHEMHDNRGVANAGLTTGIIGTALGVLNGGFGGLFGNNGGGWGHNGYGYGYGYGVCSDSVPVNRYELNQQAEITRKETEIAYLKGRDAAKSDMLALYERLDGRFRVVEGQIAAQATVNAQIAANIGCMQNQIAVLNGLTKTVIPITNVCPSPMPEFNSWTAPTAAPTTAG